MAFYISYSNWGSKNIHTLNLVAAAAKLLQSCPTLCDPIDSSPPGFPIPGILQARTLEWVAISFSNGESEKWKWSHSVVSDSSWPHGLWPTRLLHPRDFPGKNTGVGCHCLLRNLVALSLKPLLIYKIFLFLFIFLLFLQDFFTLIFIRV